MAGFSDQRRESRIARPISHLPDASAIYENLAPERTFNHHIVLYYSKETPAELDQILSLMKLRAIEHRVAVAVLAGSTKELVKTTRYKNIQRFREFDGVFGLNPESIGGTWSTAGASSSQGVPYSSFHAYLSLLRKQGRAKRTSIFLQGE